MKAVSLGQKTIENTEIDSSLRQLRIHNTEIDSSLSSK